MTNLYPSTVSLEGCIEERGSGWARGTSRLGLFRWKDGTANPYRSYSTKVGLRILTLTQQVRAIHTNMAPIKTPLELNAKSWKEA